MLEQLQSWLQAWSARDIDAYLAHYSNRFVVPGGLSREAWLAQRKERLARPALIRVFISEPKITPTGPDRVRVSFRQEYRSDRLRLQTSKQMDFVLERAASGVGQWMIVGEWVDDPPPVSASGRIPESQVIPAALGETDESMATVREVEVVDLLSIDHQLVDNTASEIRLRLSSADFDLDTTETTAAIVVRLETTLALPEVLPEPLLVHAGPLESIALTRRSDPVTLRLRLRDQAARFEYKRDQAQLNLRVYAGAEGLPLGDELCFRGKPAAEKQVQKTEEGKRLAAMRSWHSMRDCENCPEMVVVQGDRFTMGTPVGKTPRRRDEAPGRSVEIAPFAVGKFEVTVGQYRAFTAATYRIPDHGCKMLDLADGRWARIVGLDWASPGFLQGERHPVVCVSWDDAQDYVSWLAKRTGKPYRLLTEAEWEYLAATGDPRIDESILDPRNICRYANVADQGELDGISWKGGFPCEDRHWYAAATGMFRLNRHGLGDLFGNVWELLEDCWNPGYDGAPSDGRAWVCGSCQERVRRGGAWNSRPEIFRVERRSRQAIGSRSATVGFRVARDLE